MLVSAQRARMVLALLPFLAACATEAPTTDTNAAPGATFNLPSAPQQSFALTHEAHTVIGTLPLLFFGNDDQKRRYLPRLAGGEWIACFALSEADSGSDVASRTS